MKPTGATFAALLVLIFTLFIALPSLAQQTSQDTYLPIIQSSQPTPTLAPLQFQYAAVLRCDPNAGVTYANGTVHIEHVPANGYAVAFSYAPDGPIIAKTTSGPHTGYPYWDPGFFSHILGATGPREGDWHFWIVDENDTRISAIASLHTHGAYSAHSCQQALLTFDTRAPGGSALIPPHE